MSRAQSQPAPFPLDRRGGLAGGLAGALPFLHQTIAIGKDEPAGLGTNPDLDYARELAEQGYVTI
ncbi:MAG TPA: hypothetical protein VJY33_12190, partial [Isosphaeraceae bacterium]|nr:hypothetical protein [Isosphaeraceae bacterium]